MPTLNQSPPKALPHTYTVGINDAWYEVRIRNLKSLLDAVEGERDHFKMRLDNLEDFIAAEYDEDMVVIPISALEGMGRMRDELSDEIHDLRQKIALVPPALWAAAQGEPHG